MTFSVARSLSDFKIIIALSAACGDPCRPRVMPKFLCADRSDTAQPFAPSVHASFTRAYAAITHMWPQHAPLSHHHASGFVPLSDNVIEVSARNSPWLRLAGMATKK